MTSADNRIHIALSPWDLTDDYNRHAGATLVSILEHCSEPVVAHLLYDEKLCIGKEKETEYNKSCYQKIADKYGCELQYHHVEIPEWVNNIESVKKWTPGALMRLYLPELLPDTDKIIYFDCDMIINTDVVTLWNTQLTNTPFAACQDADIPVFSNKRKDIYKNVGIPVSSYFCSGTLIFNLKQLRNLAKPFSCTVFTYLQDNPNLLFPDQDMLNWFCQENYTRLDAKYNLYTYRNVLEFADDGVIHYAASGKPWKSYHGKIDDYYWDYLSKTPWCEDRHILCSYLHSAPDVSKCLPFLENNFFAHIHGTRGQKVRYAMHFIFCIIKSIIKGIWCAIVKR